MSGQVISADRSQLQSRLAYTKIICIAFLPALVCFATTSTTWADGFNGSANIGIVLAIALIWKAGTSGLLYAGMYAIAFWLLRNELYAAFIIGVATAILPSMAAGTANQTEEIEEELDLAGNCIADFQGVWMTWLYTIASMGISPSGLKLLNPASGSKGFANGVIAHTIMECILLGFFLGGSFTGKAGIGMLTRVEYLNLELILCVAAAGLMWQVTLAAWTCKLWEQVNKSGNTFSFAKLIALAILGCTLAYCGSLVAYLVVAGLMATPYLFGKVGKGSDSTLHQAVYTMPMIS